MTVQENRDLARTRPLLYLDRYFPEIFFLKNFDYDV